VGEVVSHQRLGPGTVTAGDGVKESAVLGGRCDERTAGCQGGQVVQAGLVAQAGHHLGQPPVPARPDQEQVEPAISVEVARQIARRSGLLDHPDQLRQFPEPVTQPDLSGQPGSRDLQEHPQLGDLGQVRIGEGDGAVAPVGHGLHQTVID